MRGADSAVGTGSGFSRVLPSVFARLMCTSAMPWVDPISVGQSSVSSCPLRFDLQYKGYGTFLSHAPQLTVQWRPASLSALKLSHILHLLPELNFLETGRGNLRCSFCECFCILSTPISLQAVGALECQSSFIAVLGSVERMLGVLRKAVGKMVDL